MSSNTNCKRLKIIVEQGRGNNIKYNQTLNIMFSVLIMKLYLSKVGLYTRVQDQRNWETEKLSNTITQEQSFGSKEFTQKSMYEIC